MLELGSKPSSDGIVSLRRISPSDTELLYVWRMEESTRLMFRNTEVTSFESHRDMVDRHLREESSNRWFMIEAAGRRVGTISLYNFKEHGRVAEWGRFVIAPEARHLGHGRRALKLVIAYARAIGVETLNCEVLAGNTVALRLYQDLGFSEIGAQEHAGRTFLSMAASL